MPRILLLTILLGATYAQAFSVGTIATRGCHEAITLSAARAAGMVPDAEHVTQDDRALLGALPFSVDGPWDRATLALLIGVRDNDFHGSGAANLVGLADVHLSPVLQHEHCLRSPSEDGAEGDRAALDRCRTFIVSELKRAADAAPGATESVLVALSEETLNVEVPAAAFHLGRALHTLEDSFAHTLRTGEAHTVRGVFNYVDPNVGSDYELARDGHRHLSEYDACAGGPGEGRALAATNASAEVLRAVLAADATADERSAGAEAALDQVWGYEPACSGGAAWCDHAEELLQVELGPATGCSASPGMALGALALVGAAMLRRRRAAVLCALVLATSPMLARADEAPAIRLRPAASVGLSMDRGAGVVAVGLRLPLGRRVELFSELELNPWFDVLAAKADWGSLNVSAGASVRWLTLGSVELRSSLGAGVSVLLHDTVGARVGSAGPFAQLSVLNAIFPGPGSTRFELRPEVVVSVPSLRGIPLAYHQYRLMLTLRFD